MRLPALITRTLMLLACVTGGCAANAEDRPTTGYDYNTKEMSSLQYDCNGSRTASLECTFVQTSVRKKAEPKDLPEALADAQKSFRGATKPLKQEECAPIEQALTHLRGGAPNLPADAQARLGTMPPSERDDLIKLLVGAIAFCKSPTESNLLNVTRLNHAKDIRTCKVNSHRFVQTFRRVANSQTWVANEGPEGLCGTVVIARFEQDADSKPFYNYVTKKVTTAPSAPALGTTCEKLVDQDEYKYDWKSKERRADCDYIELGW
jgi:hypothetical protein